MSDETLSQLNDDGVLHLQFNRPEKKNAFNRPAWQALADQLNHAKNNPAIACVLLSGAGKDFSSGMDLSDFSGGDDGEEHPFYAAQKAVIDFDKPLLAAAKGSAVGGGATLLFHCDIVYVGESLKMRLPFVNLGLVPEFAASYMLQAMIGARRAAELFYTAEWINAERALECGIATAIYADSALDSQAMKKAQEIAQWPVRALQETKRCLKAAHQDALNKAMVIERAGMDKLAGSPENIEAVVAFIEKRPADFKQFRQS